MIVQRSDRNRWLWIVGVSLGAHVGLYVFLTQIPAGQTILRKVIQVTLQEKPKPKPRPKPPVRKVAKVAARRPAPARALQPMMAPGGSGIGDAQSGFNVETSDAGSFEVPVAAPPAPPAPTPAPAATPEPGPPPPLELDSGDLPRTIRTFEFEPRPIGDLRVAYPEVARLANATGSAVVQAYVEADGRVQRAELVSATTSTFGRSALEAVRGSRFQPARRSGVAVACTIRLPIRFELTGASVQPVEVAEEPAEESGTVPPEQASASAGVPDAAPADGSGGSGAGTATTPEASGSLSLAPFPAGDTSSEARP